MRLPACAAVLSLSFTFILALAAPRAEEPPAPDAGRVKVWVRLADKGPAARASFGRALQDLPVHAPYVEALRSRGFAPKTRLKWQNLVSGWVNPDSLPRLRALPFVRGVSEMPRKAPRAAPWPRRPWRIPGLAKAAGDFDYGASKALMESLHVDAVHRKLEQEGKKPGQGIRIAVIDADFHLGNRIFAAMRDDQILDAYDFVEDKPQAVDARIEGSHGASCMSLIGGNLPGTYVGVAPEAWFLLYRAEEDARERYVEEDYVAAAIERAVDSGAQVINISLGYRYEYDDGSPDLPFSQFDGRTRPSSIAAAEAARRGAVVAVAMGNLPPASHIPKNTPTITAPADADSILAVGIVDERRRHCAYSCTGPSADRRVKPDVVSMGVVSCNVAVAAAHDTAEAEIGSGTSYASPVIAGIAALIRQVHPEWSAMQVRDAIIRSAHRRDTPDSLVGYGLPDAAAALGLDTNIEPVPSRFAQPGRIAGVYHQGGRGPLIVPWKEGYRARRVRVTDASGRRIAVTARRGENALLLDPGEDLRTGVYLVRLDPVKQ